MNNMIAERITELRKKKNMTQEDVARAIGVTNQAVSKWEPAQSVPDLSRVMKLSEVFGVTTDYLLRDDLGTPAVSVPGDEAPEESGAEKRTVDLEFARNFLTFKRRSALLVPLGVALCILSPVVLLLLIGMADLGRITLTDASLSPLTVNRISSSSTMSLAVARAISSPFCCIFRTSDAGISNCDIELPLT